MELRVGNGFDIHRLQRGLPLWIGGVEIDYHSGFVAHSDGDVLIHSLCDALLGALALGDIGTHFPDTDARYKGVESKILLKRCMAMVRERGYELGNCDNTILAEEPKIKPYVDKIRETLSQIMGVERGRISVKASTMEQIGGIGQGEGIAVISTVLLNKVEFTK